MWLYIVFVGLLMLPVIPSLFPGVGGGEEGEMTWEVMHKLWEIPMQQCFIVKRSGIFIGLEKLSCCMNISGW